jgi:hypothetical protein
MEGSTISIVLGSGVLGAALTTIFNFLSTRKLVIANTEKARAETRKINSEVELMKDTQHQHDKAIDGLEMFKDEILKKLIGFSMSGYIYGHLQKLCLSRRAAKSLIYKRIDETVRAEFQFLIDHGYIRHIDVKSLQSDENLAARLEPTPAGEWYVDLREQLESAAPDAPARPG